MCLTTPHMEHSLGLRHSCPFGLGACSLALPMAPSSSDQPGLQALGAHRKGPADAPCQHVRSRGRPGWWSGPSHTHRGWPRSSCSVARRPCCLPVLVVGLATGMWVCSVVRVLLRSAFCTEPLASGLCFLALWAGAACCLQAWVGIPGSWSSEGWVPWPLPWVERCEEASPERAFHPSEGKGLGPWHCLGASGSAQPACSQAPRLSGPGNIVTFVASG